MRKPLQEYLLRFLNKTWLLITGVVEFFLFLMGILFPELHIPFIVYIIILVTSLIIAGFFVFQDLFRDYCELENRLFEFEKKEPKIILSFQDKNNRILKKLELHLKPLQFKFDPNSSFVEMKNKLNEKKTSYLQKQKYSTLFNAMSLLGKKANPNYEKEVEKYLHDYPGHIKKIYECKIDRAFSISIIVENRGLYPANDVKIELFMPEGYKIPEDHQCFDRKTTSFEQIVNTIEPLWEPEPYIDTLGPTFNIPYFNQPNSIISNINPPSGFEGPNIGKRDNSYLIIYKIEKLIQHNKEDRLEPFWIWLGEINQNTTWEIPIRITSAELRKPLNDKIFVDIKISENQKTNEQ